MQPQTNPVQPQSGSVPPAGLAPTPPEAVQSNSRWLRWSNITDYSLVPFYRRRWFMVVLYLIFIPAGLILSLTGPVYGKQGKTGKVFEWSRSMHVLYIILGTIVLINNILQYK